MGKKHGIKHLHGLSQIRRLGPGLRVEASHLVGGDQ